jgi:hypothetical protein
MTFGPKISFHVPGHDGPVAPGTRLWHTALSGNRLTGSAPSRKAAPGLTVGDYFLAARSFLVMDGGRRVCEAITALTGGCGPVRAIEISLEKHGAFYHPLKITVKTPAAVPVFLVLNGAVKDPGARLVETEYALLTHLADRVTPGFIPKAFSMGTISCDNGLVRFFLGEWFDGFYEFHVTQTPGGQKVVLWKADGSHEPMSWQAATGLYEKIAYVLTAYYDIHTGHAIYRWHHAAGDFVACPLYKGFDVRLITVRGLAPIIEMPSKTASPGVRLLFCLLFYFVNMTVRMRLDREDGTGPLVFLPEIVLDASIDGLFQALDDRAADRLAGESCAGVPPDLPAAFLGFVKGFKSGQLVEMLAGLMDDWYPDAAEQSLVRENMPAHCRRICRVIADR